MQYQYTIHDKQLCHNGFFTFYNYQVSFESFAGGWIEHVARECSRKSHVAAVLAYDRQQDCFLLVEQFRIGMVERGGFPWTFEIVAGFVDQDDDDILETAKRELLEETGCQAIHIEPLIEYYGSPGGSGGCVSIFLAEVDSREHKTHTGLREEGEDICVHVLSRAEIQTLLATSTPSKLHNATALIAFSTFFAQEATQGNPVCDQANNPEHE